MNNAVRRFTFGWAAAVLLCAGYPVAGWAVPLDPILPPDAASEGIPSAAKQGAGRPSDSQNGGPAGPSQATAPPLEDITGQPLSTNEAGLAGGQQVSGTVVDGPPPGALPPPGFAVPATLSTRNWFNVQDWYSETDAQVLNHGRATRHSPVIVDTSDNQIFDRTDLGLGIAAGAHFTIGSYLGEDYQKHDHSLEMTYQGLESWNGHFNLIAGMQSAPDTATTAGNFGSLLNVLNFPNADFFNGADFYRLNYHSEFNSIELNVRVKTRFLEDQLVYEPDDGLWNRHINSASTFSYLFGFRYVNLEERLNATSGLNTTSGTIDGFPVGDFGGTLDTRVQNNLIGFQAGTELDYQYERWSVGVRGKTAVCLNFAQEETDIGFNDATVAPERFSKAKVGPAAVSEISLLAGYQISPQARLRLTYDFEFLTSVGLAPNQLNLAGPHGPGAITVSNGLFLNGLSAGLDYIW